MITFIQSSVVEYVHSLLHRESLVNQDSMDPKETLVRRYERLVVNNAVHSVPPNSIREHVDLQAQLDHEAVLEQV